jgi:hydrogenase expression/formation protein HypE
VLPTGKLAGELLDRLVRRYVTPDPSVLIGPGVGRDAAAVRIGGGVIAVKTDPITFVSDRAAAYVVDVNANDLACLGVRPRWMVVTSLLPEGKTTEADVEAQFRDLSAACGRHGIALVGGHCEVTLGLDRPILVGTLFGESEADKVLAPGGARPGDQLLLTKALAIEGTALLAGELGPRLRPVLGDALVDRAAALLDDPGISVVADAFALLATGGVTALHDPTEGGLATGLRELASAAGCGIRLDRAAVPVRAETEAVARELGLDPLGLLASGSLLVAADPAAVYALTAAGAGEGIDVTPIGWVVAATEGLTMATGDGPVPLPTFDSDEVTRVL